MTPVELKRELDFNSDFDYPVNVVKAKRFVQVGRMILTGGVAEWAQGSERIRFDLAYIREQVDRAIEIANAHDSNLASPEVVRGNTEDFRV